MANQLQSILPEVIMFEMLGNQLFLVRNYSRAVEMLEKGLWKDPKNEYIRRKLIICYTQTGEIDKALDNFLLLIKKDIHFIVDIDPVADDCPCSELVFDTEPKLKEDPESLSLQIISGILWLYCDVKRSLQYFRAAHSLDPANPKIKSAIIIIESHLNRMEQNSSGNPYKDKNNIPIT